MAGQRQQVDASEQALQRYREQTDSVSLEERQNIVVQKLADLNAAVTRAKTERIQKEAAYNQIRTVETDRTALNLDTLPAIVSNVFVQQQKSELATLQRQQAQLSDKLGPRHPDMAKLGLAIQNAEAKIQGEIGKVVQSMRNDYQQTLAQEQSLTNALEQQKRDALALNRTGIEYGVLARDAASNRQIFESLMQRTKETVRTNLLFSSAEEGARSIVITSTGPGEGKTVVATNLAVALAQAGQRVLIIDADMRKPRVHTVFNKPQQPGLSNILVPPSS